MIETGQIFKTRITMTALVIVEETWTRMDIVFWTIMETKEKEEHRSELARNQLFLQAKSLRAII